jgi:pimeloyl-ACP methyl ester carboxylesterase
MEAGQGPGILFIHGLGGQLHHFRQTLFEELSKDHRVVALDRPGSGYSTRVAGATGRLPEQAEIIARFMDALGLERPLVVGHSLGGAVALALALDRPRAISGLALLAPLTHLPDEVPPQFKSLHVASALKRWLLAHTTAVPQALKVAPQVLAYVFGPQAAPRDYMVAGGGWEGLRPSHIIATMTDFVAIDADLAEMEERYGEIGMPVGILAGDADQVIDPKIHAVPMRDRLPGTEVEIVEGLGHMVQYGATGRTTDFIRRMAAKASGRPARDAAGSRQ